MAAPSTMPVARSRPRTRRTPIMSITPAPTMPRPTKPSNGLSPISSAPEPPAAETSPSAWPAKDWPRMTVKTPTTADTTATTPPIVDRDVDRRAGEEAGLEHRRVELVHGGQPASGRGRPWSVRTVARGGPGHDQDAAVHVQHVDVVAVQPAEDLGR